MNSQAAAPNLRIERQLLRSGAVVACGLDEVGRGSLSGPVSAGMVLVDASTGRPPHGLKDSKLLTPAAREYLVPSIITWARGWAVGHASPAEIDAMGLIAALRLAGHRALAELRVVPDVVLLDGNHDWLSRPQQQDLFAGDSESDSSQDGLPLLDIPPVRTLVKADLTCASVAAASVLAKVARDAIMVGLDGEFPAYAWRENKGYASARHVEALRAIGPSVHHRRSWNLPLMQPEA